MKRLLICLTVCLLLAAGCKYTAGPFYAQDGVVACMASAIDADQKANYPQAWGGVSGRYGSCNGDAAVLSGAGVRVRIWYHATVNLKYLCLDTDWVDTGYTSGFTVGTGNFYYQGNLCAAQGAGVGDAFSAEVKARAVFGGQHHESDWLKSEWERWTLPAGGSAVELNEGGPTVVIPALSGAVELQRR